MRHSAYRVLSRLIAVIVPALVWLTSCQNDFDTPDLQVPETALKPNTTILELKESYWDDADNYIKTIGQNALGEHVIIGGRVISSDADGNIYKNLVIQDNSAALTISINANSLYNKYREGQEVVMDLTDMYIGKYSSLQQLGYPDYSTSYGWQATFMPLELFEKHTYLQGLPQPAEIDTMNVTIAQLSNSASVLQKMQSRLIRINNVHFEEGGMASFCTAHKVNTNRNLLDSDGNTIIVRTSGYAKFWSERLPAGEFDIVGILSYNGSGANAKWQLLLRSMSDILNVGNPTLPIGTDTNPYTVEQAVAIEASQQPAMGWVSGYIVGAVAGGIESVGSANDIQWQAPFDMNNTLIIGATPQTRTLDQALLIKLPQNSALRSYGNLRDNPDNLGRKIVVYGTLAPSMGTFGITDNKGTVNEFAIDGVEISGVGVASGDGTEAKPYNPTQVAGFNPTSTSAAVKSSVWVRGYIVGWVNTDLQTYACEESCQFTVPATKATNVLLATSPDERDFNNCISLNLPTGAIRSGINLVDNPGNLGALLTVKGDILKYVGIPGVKNPTEYTISGAGNNDPVNPEPPTPGGNLTFKPATKLTAGGKYIFVNSQNQVAVPVKETYSYGYLYVEEPVSTSGSYITTSSANVFVLGGSDGAWTLQDSYGRYLAMDDVDAHKSFQLYTTAQAGTAWTIVLGSDASATITNVNRNFTVRWVANFSNFAPSQTATDALPKLYELTDGSDDPTPPVNPDPKPGDGGAGTEGDPYTVATVIAHYASGSETGVWVTGYIVGSVDGASISDGAHFGLESASATNLLLAPTADCTDLSKCIPVQLPVGDVRAGLNLSDKPANLGRKVNLLGNIEKYFGVCGFKSVSRYTFP